jgi:putative nucleotidyltransferase with HDIG domain
MRTNIIEILKSLSTAQSIISPQIGMHQQQVAYLVYKIAKKLGLSQIDRTKMIASGLLHDIGALSFQEKKEVLFETAVDINAHAYRGAYLVKNLYPKEPIAPIIRYHHYPWNNGELITKYPDIPLESQMLHLADRICSLILDSTFILSQVDRIKNAISQNRGTTFVPEFVDAFLEIADQESLWLDLISDDPVSKIELDYITSMEVSIDDLVELSKIYSHLIDFGSPFTATHSSSVAHVAQKLSELLFFTETECKNMLIAGYLHDLGKLTVPNTILEKQSALSAEEFDIIRSHTYYTYQLLDKIKSFEEIKCWAAYHHERIDGKGYPFHLSESELSLGSRIMAVSDVFSALQEERPYKEAMSREKTCMILQNMVKSGALDAKVVDFLITNYQLLSEVCANAGNAANKEYNYLYQIGV